MAIVSVNLDDTVNSFRTKFNQVSVNQGDLSTLSTIDKSSIVDAINELYVAVGGANQGVATEAFKTIQVTGTAAGSYGSSNLVANLAEDTLVFVGGAGIDLTTDPSRDEIKIDLEDLGSDPEGSYTGGISAVTVDAYGRVTAITGSAGYTGAIGTVTLVTVGNGLNGGSITSTGTISIDSAQVVSKIVQPNSINAVSDDAAPQLGGELDANSNNITNGGTIAGTEITATTSLYVGDGTASHVQDEIRAEGNITAFYSSDATMKMNINPLQNALDKVKSISGVNFDWTDEVVEKRGGEDGYFVRKKDVGVIAQEIQKVLPEVVAERKDGTLAVRYEGIVPLLIEAIKELSDKVKSLEGK